MKKAALSLAKILGFLGLWALLIAAVTLSIVGVGGETWFTQARWRLIMEIGGALATLGAFVFMALVVDKRGLGTLGFNLSRLADLLLGTVLGAAIFAAPLGVLIVMDEARLAPDLAAFTPSALALGLLICLFNVITQEALVRSYIFQELWAKYGAAIAIAITTLLFVALHAAPILQGGTQGVVAGVNILLASVLLGFAYVRSGALWLPIGIHLGWNGLQGPVLGINVTGADIGLGGWRVFEFPGDALLTGGALGIEGGLAGLIGPALGIALVALAVKQQPMPRFKSETT
jgi:uncharacterized protein